MYSLLVILSSKSNQSNTFLRSLASLQYDPAHFNRYFEDKAECKYNAGTKTEYSSPPSSAGPPPPTASTGKTSTSSSSNKKSKNSSTIELDFVPLMVTTAAVAVSACVTSESRDDRSSDAEIKCEPINALAYDFPNVEMWNDDKRSKVDKNSFHSNDEMSNVESHWEGVADKSDFNKISSQQLQQFDVQRVGHGEVGPIQ